MYRWVAGALCALIAGLFYFFWKDGTNYHYLGPTTPVPKVAKEVVLEPIEKEAQAQQSTVVLTTAAKEMVQTISGLIIDRDSDLPIKGARVWLASAYEASLENTGYVLTNHQGRYQIKRTIEEWNNHTEQEWYYLEIHAQAAGYLDRSGHVDALGGGEWRGGTIALPALVKTEVIGQVLTEQGLAVAGARISRIQVSGRELQDVEVWTDEAGNYSLQAVLNPASYPSRVLVEMDGYPPVWGSREVILKQGSLVTGRIVDERGKPLRVIIKSLQSPYRKIETDKSGSFQELFSPGQLQIEVNEQGYARFAAKWKIEGEQQDLGDLVLKRGETLHGRVKNEQGLALSEVEVYLERPTSSIRNRLFNSEPDAITDSDGRFRLPHQDAETVSLHLRHADHTALEIQLTHGGQTHQLVLQKHIPVFGKILDEWGQPVPLTYLDLRANKTHQWSLSDASGSFRINHLQPGHYEVLIEPPGCQRIMTTLEIKAGQVAQEFNQEALAETYVEGIVLHPDGARASGGSVYMEKGYATIDDEGYYRIGSLKPGNYHLKAKGSLLGTKKYERSKRVNLRPGGNLLDLTIIDPGGPRAFFEHLIGRVIPSSSYGDPAKR